MGPIASQYETRTSVKAARHLLTSDLAAFERVSPGRHLERLAAISRLRDHGSGQALLSVYDIPFIFGFLALIWTLGGSLVIVPLAGLLLLSLAAIPASRASRLALDDAAQTDDDRYDFLIATLSGLQAIKMVGAERALQRRYEALQERRLTAQGTAYASSQKLSEIGQFVVQLSTIGTIGFGSTLVLDGRISIGALSACTLIVGRFLALSHSLILSLSRQQASGVAKDQVRSLFAVPVTRVAMGSLDASSAEPHLSMRDVAFSFGTQGERRVLENATLDLTVGRPVGLIGDNGSGKSTLLTLLAGLYQPEAGEIRLGGRLLTDYSEDSLRRTITLVSQQETLFSGTILDNITMFRPWLTEAALSTADRTGLSDVVMGLPKGLATLVGEGATDTLPRGVMQRISLSRALTQSPRVLLFDDANSAIDDRGDQRIAALFQDLRQSCAILIVSHRPSILNLADQVVRLAHGRTIAVDEAAA
ncbi:ATP-binding cassette subfamily C protein LapB [Roseospira visakhapatnamensis]|uniref:ATP-binding cassette subfamily C protein LapB n=1 Tax=Roseospira visakhapatnamensis TaxID=390880 RepID=A0A7W6RDS2_9PROT|nr:ATP-binding cassette subfamily C protein LapB [Roseospira visakhapatnamensis]